MKRPPGKPAPRAVGRALARTDADLDRLAAIGPDDVTAGRLLWLELAPPKYVGLMEATAERVATEGRR